MAKSSAIAKRDFQAIQIDDQALDAAIATWKGRSEADYKSAFRLALTGNLKDMSWPEKLSVYLAKCQRMGLDPTTKPFDLIQQFKNVKNGESWEKVLDKEVLYPNSICAASLRKMHGVSLGTSSTSFDGDWVTVTVTAKTRDGREDSDIGMVEITKYLNRGDATMKAHTKAKRRVTFSILGMPASFGEDPENFGDSDVEILDPPTVAELHGIEYMSAEDLMILAEAGTAAGFSRDQLSFYFQRKFPGRAKSEYDKSEFDSVLDDFSDEEKVKQFQERYTRENDPRAQPPGLD